MQARAFLLAGLLVLSGLALACADNRATAPSPAPAGCDAARVQFAIGSPASADLLERARVAAQAATARFLRPNQVITLEFLATRLNLTLSAQEIVQSAYCG